MRKALLKAPLKMGQAAPTDEAAVVVRVQGIERISLCRRRTDLLAVRHDGRFCGVGGNGGAFF